MRLPENFSTTCAFRSFGKEIAREVADKWHLDNVVVPNSGVNIWLRRAVDPNGDVLNILRQPRRNVRAAKRFLKQFVVRFGRPRVIITDKLRSYVEPIHVSGPTFAP